MRNFWTYSVRYRVARWLMHLGLWIWPAGRAKAEVLDLLYEWGDGVNAEAREKRVAVMVEEAKQRAGRTIWG